MYVRGWGIAGEIKGEKKIGGRNCVKGGVGPEVGVAPPKFSRALHTLFSAPSLTKSYLHLQLLVWTLKLTMKGSLFS